MPDWFYRTAAQRVLFVLPDEVGRAVALGTIGLLGRSTAGRAVIDFMGHMAPEPDLSVLVAGVKFTSPFGLGWRVDPEARATRGLACFGVGCIEVWTGPRPRVRRESGDELSDSDFGHTDERSAPDDSAPRLFRRRDELGREFVRLPSGRELGVVPWNHPPDEHEGIVLQVGRRLPGGGWNVPARMPDGLLASVRAWGKRLPAEAPLIVSGGVDDPADAVALITAGASLVLIDAGLVFRGPGLVKRCNEALAQRLTDESLPRLRTPRMRQAWFWVCALGAAMILGGGMTLLLALTRVLLPYDEHFLGISAEALRKTSPLLFAFMAHDRATLAGTMIGLGWLYSGLGIAGVRRGQHGARTAVIASALTGFASFFSFFGFGYFDTLHAFVAVVLFQMTVQIMVGEQIAVPGRARVIDTENAAWRRAQWGQLFWIVHAVGLLIAGGVILSIGMTSVFVSEDLAFLCLTPEQAGALDTRLKSVVAHDRATLGGMLLATGVGTLLPLLWCFRRGATWLWRAMLGLGFPAYAAALGVHAWVGYTDWRHIVPALAGLVLWLLGLVCSRGYLRPTLPKSRDRITDSA